MIARNPKTPAGRLAVIGCYFYMHSPTLTMKALSPMADGIGPQANSQERLDRGPGGGCTRGLVVARVPSRGDLATWSAYYAVPFTPRMVTPWITFKRVCTGVNDARSMRTEREHLRRDYETRTVATPTVGRSDIRVWSSGTWSGTAVV